MLITLPNIEVTFKQLASNFIKRSERGIAVLIIRDDTNKTFTTKEYKKIEELNQDNALYTKLNLQYMNDVLRFGVTKLVVIRIDIAGVITEALTLIEKTVKTGWITTVGTLADYTSIVTWIKSKEALGETYKAITYKATTPGSKHIVNLYNEKVIFTDDRAEQTADKYLPSLLGILASCNVEKGSTYFECDNLIRVQEVTDNTAALNLGQFILINDFDKVKIGLGINSLIEFIGNNTDDMRYIDIVETMDIIIDDVRNTFKNNYISKYKNNIDNQILFISAVNTYFKALAKEEVLDINYKNYSDVNIAAQRDAWVKIKPEAEQWDDIKVKNNAFKRNVFLAGDIKILAAMENLKFNISMF
ncbi:MAG: phage tail sheath C-terminal domain-containing protein [Clostridium sp.]